MLDGTAVPVISLPDFGTTKKTQRDKDWAAIGTLIDADIIRSSQTATEEQVRFWLHTVRSAEQLVRLANAQATLADEESTGRPLLKHALCAEQDALELALAKEQIDGKAADRAYWAPLIAELEQIRWPERRQTP